MPRPDLSRVPSFYHNYINQVKTDDLMSSFRDNTETMITFFKKIPENKYDHRYADDKWTIKELVQHLTDAERVFSYRALRFARKDKTPLPGFEEKLYAETSEASKKSWEELVNEFIAVRKATELLFASFSYEQLEAEGTASGGSIYVLAIGFICTGHCYHHRNIINERYL